MKKITLGLLTIFALLTAHVANAQNSTLKAGESITTGQTLVSEDGKFTFKLVANDAQKAGLKSGDRWIKSSKLLLQADGNLVIYDSNGKVDWSSKTQAYFDKKYGTAAFKPVKMVVGSDGSFNLYNAAGEKVWSQKISNITRTGV